MNRFYAAMNRLSPWVMIQVEKEVVRAADELIPAYDGGHWVSTRINRAVNTLVVPTADPNDNVRLVNANNSSDVTTDAVSAGVVISMFAVNRAIAWFHRRGEMSVVEELSNVYHALRENMLGDARLDQASINAVID